jgi:hypothetical protein
LDLAQLEPEMAAVLSFAPGGALAAAVPAFSQPARALQLPCERVEGPWRERVGALGTRVVRRALLAHLAFWLDGAAGPRAAAGSGSLDEPPPAELLACVSILLFHWSLAKAPAGVQDVVESGLARRLLRPFVRFLGVATPHMLCATARLCSTWSLIVRHAPALLTEGVAREVSAFACRALALHWELVGGQPPLPGEVMALLTRGRSRNITTITASQRPAFLSRFALTEANHFFVFRDSTQQDSIPIVIYISSMG